MVKSEPSGYEKVRQQRLEENKKRMEDLNLTKLALAVRNASPKPSPMKQVKPRTAIKGTTLVQVRRSARVSKNPEPVYKEVSLDTVARPGRLGFRKLSYSGNASYEARMNAQERAEELESKLEGGFPSFVKSMQPSHVSGCFWLGLPSHFCKTSLPKSDDVITLVDENGEEWSTVYLPRKVGLSGGWIGFSKDHKLSDGDALVFELVKPTEFKVYIIRANN
ncbi:hypothetical protein ACHQM5_005074 [Ranunculus cassubicifolius]